MALRDPFYAVIEAGGTKFNCAIVDENRNIIEELRVPTTTPAETLSACVDFFKHQKTLGRDFSEMGIASFGPLDLKPDSTYWGYVTKTPKPNWSFTSVAPYLGDALGCRVAIDTDVNAAAMAEHRWGAGQNANVVIYVTVGTGVGGGIVVNQQLLTGLQSITGEWGHNPLCPDGPRCYCGRRGCIETFLSGPALVADYARRGGEPTTTAQTIAALAEDNDPLAQGVLSVFFNYFGQALATIINILDPHVVVIGGGLSCIDALYSRGREAAAPYVFNDEFATPIVSNINGDSAGVRGAAQLWPA